MLKRLIISAVALVAALAVTPLRAEILEQVLVKVNGDILTKTEFEQLQVEMLRTRPELANAGPNSPQLQRAVSEATPDLILASVDDLLLIQRGRELGYSLGEEQFKSVLENIKRENRIETEEQFQQALKESGLTLAQLRTQIERRMFIDRVRQVEVMDRISVTEEEARAYYDAHRTEFVTPSEITLREIFIEVPQDDRGVNVAADDAARERAEEVRKRLLAGEPFARLAADFSAAASKANGGLIGPIKSDELAPALQEMINKLKLGDVTEVLRVPRGYQVLKLESRTDTRVRSFEDARSAISQAVAQQKSRGELLKYLERLREQATITWRNDELKKAYDVALERRRTQPAPAAATN